MIAGLCHVGADVLSGPQAATGRPYNTHNIRSSYAVGRDDPARRLKFAFCPSRGPDFRRRTGDISPPGEVLSMDGKYPKIPGPSSSQSTLHSERPGVGIPRTLPCSSSPNHDSRSLLGSRGLRPCDFRTQSARLGRAPNLFSAGMNLGPFRFPPAAARAGQIR